MIQLVWLSYDLGIDGDYTSLYYWLDSRKAKECGNSVAVFSYQYEKDLVDEIKKDIRATVKFRKTDRIYAVYGVMVGGNKHYKGTFLFGKRKPAPWEGFAAGESDEVADYDS
ncbi:hypothetical protein CEB3_c43260 [Peptococcaceae bacterium CEB3]|nr:hypothetical protein CEB3_c43260 [Peptococcaceae bacterium CEB3]